MTKEYLEQMTSSSFQKHILDVVFEKYCINLIEHDYSIVLMVPELVMDVSDIKVDENMLNCFHTYQDHYNLHIGVVWQPSISERFVLIMDQRKMNNDMYLFYSTNGYIGYGYKTYDANPVNEARNVKNLVKLIPLTECLFMGG